MEDHGRCAAALWRVSMRAEILEAVIAELSAELNKLKQPSVPLGPRPVEPVESDPA